jgi:hypothetical protein
VLQGAATTSAASPTSPFAAPPTCRQAADRERCARTSNPVRATKDVVLVGRKGGATTIVFALRRKSAVRFTVVRIYPSCERVGSFTVPAKAGQNRIRFTGRLDGRPLPDGVYRLLAQVRGQEKAVASVTLVVAKTKRSAANLRRPRTTACSAQDAKAIETAIGVAPPEEKEKAGGATGAVFKPVKAVVKGVAKSARGIAEAAQAVPRRLADVIPGEGLSDKIFLTIVGLGLLLITLLGTLVLMNVVRFGFRERVFRW